MALRCKSVGLALYAALIGTTSAWALAPHDRAVGPGVARAAAFSSDNAVKQPQASTEHGGVAERANGKTNEAATPDSVKVNTDDNKPAPGQNPGPGDGKEFIDEATLAIALLTLCVLIVQTSVFGVQARRLRETIDAMKAIDTAQSARMEESLRISNLAAQASAESTDITKRSLILVQRPRIRVGNIWLGNGDLERPKFFKHATIKGTFDYENIGGTDAKIVSADVIICSNEIGLPFRYPVGTRRNPTGKRINKSDLLVAKTLAPGEMDTGVFSGEGYHLFQGEQAEALAMGRPGFFLFVMGWVEFSDKLDIVRRTRFCRKYDHSSGRFLPVADPDYEYET